MKNDCIAVLPALFLLGAPVLGQVEFIGDKFQVNTVSTDDQSNPDVASTADGGFFVVWQSAAGTDGDQASIEGRFFSPDGTPQASELQVNTYATGPQIRPAVAANGDGDLVVVWQSAGSPGTDSSGTSILGQRFASDGTFLGDEFQVNNYSTGDQGNPAVGMDADGAFVVVWQSEGSPGTDSSGTSALGQRFASDGTLLGNEFQVNTYTTLDQRDPAVAVRADSGFVVVWRSFNGYVLPPLFPDVDIFGRRYASDGSDLGGEFIVADTPAEAYDPAVALDGDGDFVVVWADRSRAGGYQFSYTNLEGKSFAADGAAGGSFVVDSVFYTRFLGDPDVMVERGERFVVSWVNSFYPPNIRGRRVRSDGTVLGDIFAIESNTTEIEFNPALARDSAGRFTVVWNTGGFYADTDVFGRRFAEFFFADGFESGDTTAWATTI